MQLESFDAKAMFPAEVNLREGLSALNKSFSSSVKPESGYFGSRVIDRGNGLTELLGKNAEGHTCKDYLRDGVLYKRRENLGNHRVRTTDFDDRGTAYLVSESKLVKNKGPVTEIKLAPNTEIVKGNYRAITDELGRPIRNRIEDLQLRDTGAPRQTLSKNLRDSSYRKSGGEYIDQRGHIIADFFGGPATKDNVVAQLDEVNLSRMKRLEQQVRDLKEAGHKVDFEVKTNYIGKDKRPTSFEPKITVDGKEFTDLPPELRKIYNSHEGGAMSIKAKHALVDFGEGHSKAHELGKQSALVAAGITFSVSTVENVSGFVNGEITGEEMVKGIVGDTVAAGALAYGTTFVTESVAQAMKASSRSLICKVGGSCLPAAVVSFGVASYHDVTEFAEGKIDAGELAYNFGENAAEVAGGIAGGALAGAAVGSVAGPVGAAAGAIVGGVVGTAVAAEVYASAVEIGTQGAELLASHVDALANETVSAVREVMPEKADEARDALNAFFAENNLPFAL